MKYLLTLLFLLHITLLQAQDTFSIVAVDPATGQVGSAGASCIGGAIIISDILPGKGAIHTQSFWEEENQINARAQMEAGSSPTEIIAWLTANDNDGTPFTRQYGIVDFDDDMIPRTAGYTGPGCFDYKDHILGDNYAIQGNILIGAEVLENMEQNFLNTQGTLAERLMASMQGANIPGADSRCLDEGVSSLSAFIRIAGPNDTAGDFMLDLNVPSTPFGEEPIDSLQSLFDGWLLTNSEEIIQNNEISVSVFPNPSTEKIVIHIDDWQAADSMELLIFDLQGKKIHQQKVKSPQVILDNQQLKSEKTYIYQLLEQEIIVKSGKLLFL